MHDNCDFVIGKPVKRDIFGIRSFILHTFFCISLEKGPSVRHDSIDRISAILQCFSMKVVAPHISYSSLPLTVSTPLPYPPLLFPPLLSISYSRFCSRRHLSLYETYSPIFAFFHFSLQQIIRLFIKLHPNSTQYKSIDFFQDTF